MPRRGDAGLGERRQRAQRPSRWTQVLLGCGWFDSSHELNAGVQVTEHLTPERVANEVPLGWWLDWQSQRRCGFSAAWSGSALSVGFSSTALRACGVRRVAALHLAPIVAVHGIAAVGRRPGPTRPATGAPPSHGSARAARPPAGSASTAAGTTPSHSGGRMSGSAAGAQCQRAGQAAQRQAGRRPRWRNGRRRADASRQSARPAR